MPLDALLLDLDGTLADTNPLHVEAFSQTFQQFGYRVAPSRIEPEIGKGGDYLIGDVLGASVEKDEGDAIRAALKTNTLELLARRKVAVFPGAREIFDAAHRRGLQVVIATSGEKEFLEAIEKSCGVPFSELADLVITASDARASKPSPDIFSAATQKLGFTPAQCAVIGDTIHDAHAARAAGVVCFGVLTGTHADADLREAGARKSYRDVGEIAENFDAMLAIASPLRIRLDQNRLESLMREALQCARDGMDAGGIPIGSIVANGDGEIIGRGFNTMGATQNPIAHAEIVALENTARRSAPAT